jgi:hypothetical protein
MRSVRCERPSARASSVSLEPSVGRRHGDYQQCPLVGQTPLLHSVESAGSSRRGAAIELSLQAAMTNDVTANTSKTNGRRDIGNSRLGVCSPMSERAPLS